jgi:uncharacterized protein (TIRG00374 family)
MKRLLNLIILSIFVFFLFTYFNENKEIIGLFSKINIWYIILFLNLAILNLIFRTFFNIYIFKTIEINISLKESFDLVLKNTIGNLLGPLKAGAGHNLHYMYKNYNLSPTLYLSVNTAFAVLLIFINFLYLLFVTLSFDNLLGLSKFNISLIIFFSILIAYLILKFSIKFEEKINVKVLRNFVTGFLSLFKDKALFLKITLTTALYSIYNVFILYLTFEMFDFGIKFKNTLLYTMIGSFTSLVKLTPGNIGFYEFVMISSSGFHGIGTDEVLMSSIFLRSSNYISVVILFIFSFVKKLKKSSK